MGDILFRLLLGGLVLLGFSFYVARKKMIRIVIAIIGTFILFALVGIWVLYRPFFWPVSPVDSEPSEVSVSIDRLEKDVAFLTAMVPSRSFHHVGSLNRAADYIEEAFSETGCQVQRQTFAVQGRDYHNIICSFGREHEERLIMGAHYDVHYDDNPGADDNASGVAGVLELARLIAARSPRLSHRLDLIAYTLEEQPAFNGGFMGSAYHAQSLRASEVPVKAMISVEMIGYFLQEPGSQTYPIEAMKWLYGDRGNFLAVVGTPAQRALLTQVRRHMSRHADLSIKALAAPQAIPGVGFSDHRSYWEQGYPAVMVTDTSFYRNPHYHQPTDTIDTLDFEAMREVVEGLYGLVIDLD